MKFLVIGPSDEAEAIRGAVMRERGEALALDSMDGLPGWLAAARPDVIVLSAEVAQAGKAGAGGLQGVSDRIRALSGGAVPIVFLCEASEKEAASEAGDLALVRPVAAEEVARQARSLAEREAGASSANELHGGATRPASDAALSAAVAGGPPILQPLREEVSSRNRVSSRPPRGRSEDVPWTEAWMPVLTASIDQTLDAEMAEALEAVLETTPMPEFLSDDPVAPAGFSGREQETLELSRHAVDTMLARARLGPEATPAPVAQPFSWRRAGGGEPLPVEGTLGPIALADLMGAALEQGITGRLRVRRAEIEKSIFFEAGRPVLAVSNASSDRMVQMLVRNRTLTQAQAERAIALATESRRRMGALLVDLGFLKASELLPAVRQHYEEIIASLFSWTDGQFRFDPGETADPRRVRLLAHPAALVLEGIGRVFSDERLVESFGPPDQILRLRTHAAAADILLEIGANDPGISRLPVLFDGVRTLDDVVRVSGQPRTAVLQVALVLRAFGLLRRQGDGLRHAQAAPAELLLRDSAVDRERIRDRMRFVREGTYFDVLGVSAEAGSPEIRAAYERLRRESSDAVLGPALAAELASELVSLRAVLDEAILVLGSEALRAAYRAEALPEGLRSPAPSPPGPATGGLLGRADPGAS